MGTDAVLLERYARHHVDEAFTELVRRHVDLVYSAALRQVRGGNLTLGEWRGLRRRDTLGLSSCFGSPTVFHAANLYPVTGQGMVLDVAPLTPVAPETPVLPPRSPKREPQAEF